MQRAPSLLFVALMLAVQGQQTQATGRDWLKTGYKVDVWTTDEEVAQNSVPGSTVFALTQTRDGYLWVGTLNGLARFDGVRFEVFDESNTPGLKSSKVVKLYEDSRGNLWIGTETGGIFILNQEGKLTSAAIDRGQETAGGKLAAWAEDRIGAVWLYTADGRLGRYYNSQMSVSGADPTSSRLRALATEAAGYLWIGTDYSLSGLQTTAASRDALPAPFRSESGKLDYLLTSRAGGYWRFWQGRIQLCASNSIVRDLGPYPWPSKVRVSAACEDPEGNLVVGTYGATGNDPGDGVYWFERDGSAKRVEGLSHASIMSVLVDREGSLWAGTDGGGLNRVRRQAFGVVEGSGGLPTRSVCEDGSGGVWLGYNSEQIDHLDRISGKVTRHVVRRPGVDLLVRSTYVDREGRVWAGTFGGGLFEFRDGAFAPVPGFEDAANPQISAIYQARDGRLWVGTQGGLAYKKGNFWRTFSTLDGLSANAVTAVIDDPAGNLWVGTEGGGVNRVKGLQVTRFGREQGLPGEDVASLYVDSEGVVWAGTSGGLARFNGEKWTAYTMRQGLPANGIGSIIEDKLGNLWLVSRAGLLRVSKKTLNDVAAGHPNRIAVRVYAKGDGLPTREFYQGSQPAAWRTRDGILLFATTKGTAWVDPAGLATNTNPPPVVINAVLVDGERQNTNTLRIEPLQRLTLPASKEALEIHFTSLALGAPTESRCQYRLEGHEGQWTEVSGNRGVARYTRLPKGDYVFRVKAANEDQVWNAQGSTLAVTVLPPYWQTWWFLTFTTLVLLGVIVGSVHYVSTQKLQRQVAALRQQEALERERARIARDLHDELGANLTRVALLGEMAEADKETPEEVENHARQIAQTARETTRALDEIVWTVNPANDTLDGLVNYICKYAQEYLALAGLKYRLEIPAQLPRVPISPELRHDVFLAAKEAVNNMVKHSGARSAWVTLHLHPGRFVLEIQDDGRGIIAADEQKGRNGLKNMRRRMQDAGGEFALSTRTEGGTIVRLTAPLAAEDLTAGAHASAPEKAAVE